MLNCKRKVPFDVKSTIINVLLELLSPKRCVRCGALGSVFCDCCRKYLRMTNPGYMITVHEGFCRIMIGGIKEGILSRLIKEYKYGGKRNLAGVMADLVKEDLIFLVENEKRVGREVVIVPLPTINKHIRMRGFDHIRLITQEFEGICRVEPLIIRKENTVQVGKGADVRLRQAREAYKIAPGVKCDSCCKYVLFDDVWTTGGSMRAALEVLKAAGAREVDALLIASNDYIETTKNLPEGRLNDVKVN